MSNISKSMGWDAEKVRLNLCSPDNYDDEVPEKQSRTHIHIHSASMRQEGKEESAVAGTVLKYLALPYTGCYINQERV